MAILRENAEELLRDWEQRVTEDPLVPSAARLTEPELRNEMPKLVDSLAHAFAGEKVDSAVGRDTARSHARQRIANGFGILQELREIAHLRNAIIDMCAKRRIRLDTELTGLLSSTMDEFRFAAVDEIEQALRRAEEEQEHLLDGERAARAEAERAAELRDEFISTVSHELRTPLSAILGWTRLLRDGNLDAGAQAKALEVIERNARVQTDLVEDLLDMSRIGSGKLRLEAAPVDLAAVVERAVTSHLPQASAAGLRLNKSFEVQSCTILGEERRLEQIVSNLLSNALKFTPKGGQVNVALRAAGSHAEVVVTDTGKGIKPEFLPHVFDRFRQADGSVARGHPGLGLGLALVKFLVAQHGGEVRAESEGENRGSTFTVRLPLASTGAVYSRPATPIVAAGSLEGIRVLVVENEQDARWLIRRLLENFGVDVNTATSATEALERLPASRPDVVISDIGMPEMDGYQFIRRVRALAPDQGGRTPAIALTAFARPEDRERALEMGYDAHVVKPIDQGELLVAIAKLSGRVDA